MTPKASRERSPERLAPLLCSIQREINERVQYMSLLEQRLEAFQATRRAHSEEVSRLEFELSLHRRALQRIANELSLLGVPFDAEHPHDVSGDCTSRQAEGKRLEDTGFRSRMADSRT